MIEFFTLLAVVGVISYYFANKYDDGKQKNIINNLKGDLSDDALKEL